MATQDTHITLNITIVTPHCLQPQGRTLVYWSFCQMIPCERFRLPCITSCLSLNLTLCYRWLACHSSPVSSSPVWTPCTGPPQECPWSSLAQRKRFLNSEQPCKQARLHAAYRFWRPQEGAVNQKHFLGVHICGRVVYSQSRPVSGAGKSRINQGSFRITPSFLLSQLENSKYSQRANLNSYLQGPFQFELGWKEMPCGCQRPK